jgi:DNA-directed RNA polymerase subunit RPC12/RpoP
MHISTKEDKIIVFQQFNNVIEANIAKTKLDAYDVPCFLTDENFVSLYPIQNDIFPGVRLCIFEKDEEQARDVLKENNLLSSAAEIIRCTHCRSTHVVREVTRKPWAYRTATVLVALFIPLKAIYYCQDCGQEFSHL